MKEEEGTTSDIDCDEEMNPNEPDCEFLLGSYPNQSLLRGFRIVLAMGSPVFHAMFFGFLAEKYVPIVVTDVEPEAFNTLITFWFRKRLVLQRFEDVYDLYYAAAKYMHDELLESCETYMLRHLNITNACYMYEFAKYFNRPNFAKSIMKYIATNTHDIINDPIFLNVEPGTLLDIFDEQCLGIFSELELFECLRKFAAKLSDDECSKVESKAVANHHRSDDLSTGVYIGIFKFENVQRPKVDETTLREALRKISFLKMSPKQFIKGPSRFKLLTPDESSTILAAIENSDYPMPEGFCTLREPSRCTKKTYTLRITKIWRNRFKAVYDVSVPGQSLYNEIKDLLSYSIHNCFSENIGSTSSLNRETGDLLELIFRTPIVIPRNELFTIEVHIDFRETNNQLKFFDETDFIIIKFTFKSGTSHRLQTLTFIPSKFLCPELNSKGKLNINIEIT